MGAEGAGDQRADGVKMARLVLWGDEANALFDLHRDVESNARLCIIAKFRGHGSEGQHIVRVHGRICTGARLSP
jgi:hypothetical protein